MVRIFLILSRHLLLSPKFETGSIREVIEEPSTSPPSSLDHSSGLLLVNRDKGKRHADISQIHSMPFTP